MRIGIGRNPLTTVTPGSLQLQCSFNAFVGFALV